jgi:LPXTG-motif cell wall-anchored protein
MRMIRLRRLLTLCGAATMALAGTGMEVQAVPTGTCTLNPMTQMCTAANACQISIPCPGGPVFVNGICRTVIDQCVCVSAGDAVCPPTSTPTSTPTDTGTATNTPTMTPTGTPSFTPTVTPTNTPVPQGGTCATPSRCSTGFCVDAVCCDTACTDPLKRCNLPGEVGTCASPPATAPALTPWGLVAGLILLAGTGVWALRRRVR